MQRLRKGDRATIYWEDSFRRGGYTRSDEIEVLDKICTIESTGVVAHVGKKYIALAIEIDDDGDYRDTHSIYRKCITKIDKLHADT